MTVVSDQKSTKKYPKLYQCRTVGQLIVQLERLPKDLQLGFESEDGMVLVPVNVGRASEHLCVETVSSTSWNAETDWLERE